MALFGKRPSRPIAISMVAVAAVLVVFGVITFSREGFSWFAVVWLAVAGVILAALARRLLTKSSEGAGLGYRPSKPMAVASAVVGAGMVVVGLTQFAGSAFVVLWVTAIILIVGGNLWAAFRSAESSDR